MPQTANRITYTDTHPIVLESKKRLRSKFRHYAPVIVDVFYDHFIARDWHFYAGEPLLEFTHRFYQYPDSEQRSKESQENISDAKAHVKTPGQSYSLAY